MRRPGLHRRFLTDAPTTLQVLHALHHEQHRDRYEVKDLEDHFQGADRAQVRKAVVRALGALVDAGRLAWWHPPTEVVEYRARDQIWGALQADLETLWRVHALPPLHPEHHVGMLARIWMADAEALAKGLEGTLEEAPLRWLMASFPEGKRESVPEAPAFLPEIDADAVYRAIDLFHEGEGATFEELVTFFGIREPAEWAAIDKDGRRRGLIGSPAQAFGDLLDHWVKANEFLMGDDDERYRTNPGVPIGNAIRLYLELWPWRHVETLTPYGPTEGGEKVGLTKATVSEHFEELRELGLLERTTDAKPKHRPRGVHVLARLARVVAAFEAESRREEPAQPVTLGRLLGRLGEDRRGEPFHRLTEDARLALVEGAVHEGVLDTESWNRHAPDLSAPVRLSTRGRFAVFACDACGGPIVKEDLVELRGAVEGDGWRWAGIRHAACPAEPRGWELGLAPDHPSKAEHNRRSPRCVTCEGSLFRVTAADILRQRPEGGHAALYALRRIRVILARSPRRDPSLGVPADPDALLRMLDAPGLTWRRREALLADFLAYVEQTDLGPPIEREAWLSRIARFEARYHQNEGDLFLVFPVHEEDPRDRFAWTVRRAAGEGPAFGMIERWGYRHASCPPPKDEG